MSFVALPPVLDLASNLGDCERSFLWHISFETFSGSPPSMAIICFLVLFVRAGLVLAEAASLSIPIFSRYTLPFENGMTVTFLLLRNAGGGDMWSGASPGRNAMFSMVPTRIPPGRKNLLSSKSTSSPTLSLVRAVALGGEVHVLLRPPGGEILVVALDVCFERLRALCGCGAVLDRCLLGIVFCVGCCACLIVRGGRQM